MSTSDGRKKLNAAALDDGESIPSPQPSLADFAPRTEPIGLSPESVKQTGWESREPGSPEPVKAEPIPEASTELKPLSMRIQSAHLERFKGLCASERYSQPAMFARMLRAYIERPKDKDDI